MLKSRTWDDPTPPSVRFIPLSYINDDAYASARRLILNLLPEWGVDPGEVEFTRFTEGITNTVCLERRTV